MKIPIATLYLPLYFITAWAMSNRKLADKLKYNLPLSLRSQCPSIRHFWFYDLLFSTMALPLVIVATNLAVKNLLEDVPGGQEQLAGLFYTLSYVLMGFVWPRVATISLSFGEDDTSKASLSIGRLRDYFLGGPVLQSVNDNLRREIESFVDRVLEAIVASPDVFMPMLRQNGNREWRDGTKLSDADIDEVRAQLMKCAETNFYLLYDQISRVEMIPLIDRHKPLMRVPQITFREERILYESGIRSIYKLYFCRPTAAVQGIAPERLQLLRRNARGLVVQWCRRAVSVACVTGCLILVGYYSASVTAQNSAPEAGTHRSNLTADASKGIYRP